MDGNHVSDFGNLELQTSQADDDIAVKSVRRGWDLMTKAGTVGVFSSRERLIGCCLSAHAA